MRRIALEGTPIVDGSLPIVTTIKEEVLAMERRVLGAFLERDEVNRIFHLRRELMRFQRLLVPTSAVAQRLEQLDSSLIDPEVRPYFRDVRDHIDHTQAMGAG